MAEASDAPGFMASLLDISRVSNLASPETHTNRARSRTWENQNPLVSPPRTSIAKLRRVLLEGRETFVGFRGYVRSRARGRRILRRGISREAIEINRVINDIFIVKVYLSPCLPEIFF